MIASDVMDFPEPDSPTRPRTSPGAIAKLRSRTAATGDAHSGLLSGSSARVAPGKLTVRFRTSRSGATRSMVSAQTDRQRRLSLRDLLLSQNQWEAVLSAADHHNLGVGTLGEVFGCLDALPFE